MAFFTPIRVGDRRIVSYCSRGQLTVRRVQFIELHEQPWFSSSLRHEITDALQFGLNLLKAYAPVASLLQSVLDSTRSRSIVDMCSGSGGPWLGLSRKLQPAAQAFHILLTDKYPNLSTFQNVRAASENRIAEIVDGARLVISNMAPKCRRRSPRYRREEARAYSPR